MAGCGSIFFFFLLLFLGTLVFPLPFNDDSERMRYGSFPWVTITLIMINIVVFVAWIAPKMVEIDSFCASAEACANSYYPYYKAIWTYGFRGSYLIDGASIGAFVTFTSIFMHANLNHIVGNMAYLWTFGHRLEDATGSWRFLIFYLICGMVANMGSYLLNPSGEDVPGIGASGAIAGVMGAYLLLFYHTKIDSLWLGGSLLRLPTLPFQRGQVDVWKWTIPIPAWQLLIFFAVSNTVYALGTIQEGQSGGVNYLAHYMGFVAGIAIFLFARKDIVTRYFTGRTL